MILEHLGPRYEVPASVISEWERIENSLFTLSKSVDGTTSTHKKCDFLRKCDVLRSRAYIFPYPSSETNSTVEYHGNDAFTKIQRIFTFSLLYSRKFQANVIEMFDHFLNTTCFSNMFSAQFKWAANQQDVSRYPTSHRLPFAYYTPVATPPPLNVTPESLPLLYYQNPPVDNSYYNVSPVAYGSGNRSTPVTPVSSSESTPEPLHRDSTISPPPGMEELVKPPYLDGCQSRVTYGGSNYPVF